MEKQDGKSNVAYGAKNDYTKFQLFRENRNTFICQLKSKCQMLQNSENPVLPINKVLQSVYAHKHKTQSTLQKWKIYAMLFTLFQLFTI